MSSTILSICYQSINLSLKGNLRKIEETRSNLNIRYFKVIIPKPIRRQVHLKRYALWQRSLYGLRIDFHSIFKESLKTNPKRKLQKPLHSPKVSVWAAISTRGIDPCSFEDARGCAVTVNAERCVDMLTASWCLNWKTFLPITKEHGSRRMAQRHIRSTYWPRLRQIFPGNQISRRGDINWFRRRPDFTPIDFLVWGYCTYKVYAV